MNKLQYVIKMHNRNKEPTFEQKFYINQSATGEEVLEQLVNELKQYHLEFDVNDMTLMIANNKNPREVYVVMERCK